MFLQKTCRDDGEKLFHYRNVQHSIRNIPFAPNPSVYLNTKFLRHTDIKLIDVCKFNTVQVCQSHQFPYNPPDSKLSPWLSISSVIIALTLITRHCSDLQTTIASCWHSLIHCSKQDNRTMKWIQTDALRLTPLHNKKLRCSVKCIYVSLSQRMHVSRCL